MFKIGFISLSSGSYYSSDETNYLNVIRLLINHSFIEY